MLKTVGLVRLRVLQYAPGMRAMQNGPASPAHTE
jgi:hypothetical protein